MTNEEIKSEKDKMYNLIKNAKERLEEIRQICKHENTSVCNYEWRIGSVIPAKVCDYCGKVIYNKEHDSFFIDSHCW